MFKYQSAMQVSADNKDFRFWSDKRQSAETHQNQANDDDSTKDYYLSILC